MSKGNGKLWRDLLVIALLALGARLAFVFFAGPHVYGDGTGYPRQGMQIVTGEADIDTSWLGAFSFWLAAVYWLIPSLKWCAIVGTLIPGVLLVSVAQLLGLRLYDRRTGLLCGLFCALHPLLIVYSTNGYMETFYCLLLALATLCLCELLVAKPGWRRRGCAWSAGLAMALAFATRNEALLLALATLVVPWFGVRIGVPAWRQKLGDSAGIAIGFGVGVACYMLIAVATTGSYGVFGKLGNLSRHNDIFLEREAAAAEVYGAGGIIEQVRGKAPGATAAEADGFGVRLSTLANRLMRNLRSALPGSAVRLFASPLPLLALIPILGWLRGRGWRRELISPCLMLAFFPAFFSLYAVQPRYLMPTVVPMHLFAAAGAVMLADWLGRRNLGLAKRPRASLATVTLPLLVILCAAALWKGGRMRAERDLHRDLAAWLLKEVPLDDTIAGCGFGHVGDTMFRSGHPFLVRVHTDEPAELERFVSERTDGWLVLYEDYLSDANPALLRYLEEPLPGFRRIHEVRVDGGLRAQVFELAPNRVAVEGGRP